MWAGKELQRGAGDYSPLPESDVWPRAQKAMPRFRASTFFSLVFFPAAMTVLFAVTFVHDIFFSERRTQFCWELANGGDGGKGMHWAGAFLHWLSMDWSGQVHYCSFMPKSEALIIYFLILPPTWITILSSAWVTRRLRRDKGVIRSLLERVYRALEGGGNDGSMALQGYLSQVEANKQTQVFLEALIRDGRNTRTTHVMLCIAFQVAMLWLDYFVKAYTMRWILWYQLLWFSFSTTITQVRPLVKFCCFLSRTAVDLYIEQIKLGKASWLVLMEWHRELELDMLALWGRVNLHSVMPSLPFASLSLVHLLVDANIQSGTMVASFLLAVAGLVLVAILQPIAKVTTMFNSSLALKGVTKSDEEIRKPGSLSIVAVARSLAIQRPPRSPTEDQQYATFLEYVQGADFSVCLGVPGYFMAPIDSGTVASIFQLCIVKLPLFVSLFLAARQRVDKPHQP